MLVRVREYEQVAARLRQGEPFAYTHAFTRQVYTGSQQNQTRLLSVVSSLSLSRSFSSSVRIIILVVAVFENLLIKQ